MSKPSRQRPPHRPGIPSPEANSVPASGVTAANGIGIFSAAWRRVLEFSGARGEATYLWPRWLALRAVGAVFVLVFAGIIKDQLALAGPDGIAPISEYLQHITATHGGAISSFFAAPTLFWIDSGTAMIGVLSWLGMGAALALVLNLWPRMALFVCWAIFLSFVSTWHAFSGAQLDNLMLETALLCIPFAPRGFRPGLGADSAPGPLILFMIRWFLFRVIFEAGAVKLAAGDPHWRDFSAMDIMYETSPFPTILGYFDHQMPRIYHVGEILFTFFTELVAPLLAVFAGRRGRWIAFISWTLFQAGIQLTNNFGWLNTVSIGLGLLLLDDQMLAAAAQKFRLRSLAARLSARVAAVTPTLRPRWPRLALAIGLWVHFSFSVFYFAKACGVPVYGLSPVLTSTVNAVRPFGSVNEYYLYAKFANVRYQVEFLGSNDGGQTWRTYEYRYMPQRADEICPFIAPWFVRFDASMELEALKERQSAIFRVVASHLLKPNPVVVSLFRDNPFPDAPPTILRMRGYRLHFTNLATHKKTGRYWNIEPAGDYQEPMRVDETGRIVPFDMAAGEAELSRGNVNGAMMIFAEDYRAGFHAAGFRLADYYLRGVGTPAAQTRAAAIFRELAHEGEVVAELNLGICHEHGLGLTLDLPEAARWYRLAASHGSALAHFNLGALYATDRLFPRQDGEALAALYKAGALAVGEDPVTDFIREHQPELVKVLESRMSAAAIATARENAAR